MRRLNRLKELWKGEGPNLNVGCKTLIFPPPFINIDINEQDYWKEYPEYIFVVKNILHTKYPDNHFWLIYASEIIEHFPYGASTGLLRTFYRMLKPDGCLKICCPNFKYAVDVYLGRVQYKDYDPHGGLLAWKDEKPAGMRMMGAIWRPIYGGQRATKNGMAYLSHHQTIWDEESLRLWLEHIGFKDVERVYDRRDGTQPELHEGNLCMEAWK